MSIEGPPNSRPAYVTVAVGLLAAASIIGITKLTMRGTFAYPQIASLLIYVWGFLLAWVIFHGKNWARWVYLVLVAMAVLDLIFSPAEIRWRLSRPAPEIAWFCFGSLLSPVAVALLFLPTSNEWFRQQKNAA